MSGETEQDPSGLSVDNLNNQVDRQLRSERDWVISQLRIRDQRLDGIDKATAIFTSNLERVPTDVDKQVANLRELHNERFKSIALQFAERDTRAVRESLDSKEALAAALSAAKEAVAEQNKSNSLAISKSEAGTVETISKLSELVDVNIKGLIGQITDMKESINSVRQEFIAYQARVSGGHDQRSDSRSTLNIAFGVIAAIAAIIATAAVLYSAIKP